MQISKDLVVVIENGDTLREEHLSENPRKYTVMINKKMTKKEAESLRERICQGGII